ncbi:MAG: hypothetical protein ACE5DX_03295 [Candidatus Dojkabacteria bacterium]
MADTDKIAFVASEELSKKIKRLQKVLALETPGEVISMGLSMLELAQGREIELKDKKKSFKISKFSKYNQTVILDDGGS